MPGDLAPRRADGIGAAADVDDAVTGVLDELRLDPSWPAVRAAAVSQALAARLARRAGVTFDGATLARLSPQIWADRNVSTADDLERWMHERHIDEDRVRALVHAEVVRQWGEQLVAGSVDSDTIDRLQLGPEYARLSRRARDKRAQLAARGLLDRPSAVGITYQELLTWWSRHRPHLAPSRLAEDPGRDPFGSADAFRLAMINEYHYVTRCHPAPGFDAPRSGLDDSAIVTRPAPWA